MLVRVCPSVGARITRFALALLLVTACAPGPDPTTVPSTGTPTTPSSKVDTAPCNRAVGSAAQLTALDEAPPPPDAPGAAPPGAKLNAGRRPTTPVNPDAVIPEQPVGPTVLPAPGAQDPGEPRAVVPLTATRAVGRSSQIAEPEVAVKGDLMLLTWNWGAAQSLDGGTSLTYLDPFAEFDGTTTDDGFCCDQLAHYDPEHDLWLWVLQYSRAPGQSGNNRVRIATATGDEAFRERRFSYWDVTAQEAGFDDGIWLDQTKLGTTDGYLYLSINAYAARPPDGTGQFQAAIVYRIALDQLAAGEAVTPVCFTTSDQLDAFDRPLFAPYPVRDATDTMYLAAHHDTTVLGVWRWPDDAASPTYHRVRDFDTDGRPIGFPLELERVVDDGSTVLQKKFTCERTDPSAPAASPTMAPGRVQPSDWCRRSDDRLSSGWLADGHLGFAWNVTQDSGTGAGWPYPYVWVILIDESRVTACELGECVLAYPHIRNGTVAFQHGRIAPNSRGDLGGMVLMGGGASPLSCVAIVRDRDAPAETSWDAMLVERSDVEPLTPTSGDYLGVWPDGGNDRTWTGTCMTLEANATLEPRRPATVQLTQFGRRADAPQPDDAR